jgi:hypothetical protein
MKQQWLLFLSCKFLYNLFGLEVPNVDMVVLAPRHNPLPACNVKIQRINEQVNKGCPRYQTQSTSRLQRKNTAHQRTGKQGLSSLPDTIHFPPAT